MFKHLPSRSWPKVKRKNIDGTRHYVDADENIYFSVTNVVNFDKDLEDWYDRLTKQYGSREAALGVAEYIKVNAGIIGTKLHSACEDYLNNEFQYRPIDLMPKAHFDNIKPMLDKIDNIKGQEIQMFSKKLGLAGTVDCVAEYEGVPCIIDFKTSRKLKKEEWIESYYLQATAYSLMWEENTGEVIKELRILMTAEDGQTECFRQNRDNFVDKLHETIHEFQMAHSNRQV